jgi:hypothetical protein
MHIIGEIPHPKFKITIFKMNHRIALKIEDSGLEQWYKFRDGTFTNGVADLKNLVNDKFIANAIEVFNKMQSNKIGLLEQDSEDQFFDQIT